MPSVVCAQPAVPVTDRAPGTRVKFRSESLALLVPVSLNGAPRLFFVDTGATMTAVDRSFRDILGVALRTATVRTPDGKAEMDVFKAPPATIAGGPLTGVREVLCLDLSGVRGAVGDDFYGILGMDFLRHRTVRIDFDRGEVLFSATVPDDAGTPIPLEVWPKHPPTVTLAVAGLGDVTFLVDTGSSESGSLDARLSASLLANGGAASAGTTSSQSVVGSSTSRMVRVAEIALGNFRHRRIVFSEGEANVLGLGYLSRYIVTFDFPRKRLYLKRGARFDAPALCDLGGPGIVRSNRSTLISDVDQGSAADFAGLEVGDVIQRVDDDDTESLTLTQIRKRFCIPGLHRLRIMRGSEKLHIALVLIGADAQETPPRTTAPKKRDKGPDTGRLRHTR